MLKQRIPRDISWLSFNARVLQEASDLTVPIQERIKFLGIFSNNLDEFFRIRVATLYKMIDFLNKKAKIKANIKFEINPHLILNDIDKIVFEQRREAYDIWKQLQVDMKKEGVILVNEQQLDTVQKSFVKQYFEEQVRVNITPIMLNYFSYPPFLRDGSLYLSVDMRKQKIQKRRNYAIIEIPTNELSRFVMLPSAIDNPNKKMFILLEDVIRFSLSSIFNRLGYYYFESYIIRMTKDAEIDIDNDVSTTLLQKIEKGLQRRNKGGELVRFTYDKAMNREMASYLKKRLLLTSYKNNISPSYSYRLHSFRDFRNFPQVFKVIEEDKSFIHPLLCKRDSILDVIQKQDIMLHFPYHSFDTVIDLLIEAAMDPFVYTIKITAYRLAKHSKIINALINAKRNGKKVVVVIELKARFDEASNIHWKNALEDEGIEVYIGFPNLKIHCKMCIIKSRKNEKKISYGFISTGNLNEDTAKIYADHCLLTARPGMMQEIDNIFQFLESPHQLKYKLLHKNQYLVVSPYSMRNYIEELIQKEVQQAKKGRKAAITLKLNSLSDDSLLKQLYDAAAHGVTINLIIRGIYCCSADHVSLSNPIKAISIIDRYLEHARVLIFHNKGEEKVFISSADWMVRNLDHRIEVMIPIEDKIIKEELIQIIDIQLSDNQKARILDSTLSNNYVSLSQGEEEVRSQKKIYSFLYNRKNII